MNRRIAALSLSVAAVLALAGCTVAPPSDDADTSTRTAPSSSASARPSPSASGDAQSIEEACTLIQDTITEATEDFGEAATTDPAQVVEAMESAAEKLSAAASRISNDDVAAVLPDLQDMFAKTAEVMQGIVDGDVSKLEELSTLGDDFQETSERFQQLCAPE
ncbi:hypothetical protein [Microbacterium sp. BK668]|uniref:hypothetical protein n=1 Tax=Microbacterium sp. BK668 TaxID=2512118 RepID=UPI00105B995F|nr:hypothetical protein [Microbacterium sp. BK668]TDN87701.1 hypothetical protein EV279_3127 [Microbacterium sp. BK668]